MPCWKAGALRSGIGLPWLSGVPWPTPGGAGGGLLPPPTLGSGWAYWTSSLAARVPEGPFHYPEDQMSDAPLRYLAAEITREKIYRHLHQELPYQSTVETDTWAERKDGSVKIEQTIFVERDSQRKIVLGKGGATIRSIGEQSRKEIAEIVGQPVHLFLFVKVRDGWGDDPERYREMGLDFPKE